MSSPCREVSAHGAAVLGTIAVTLLLTACSREERRFSESNAGTTGRAVAVGELQAGPATARPAQEGPYDYNAYAISQGQRLYEWMNCSGCHAGGGGDIGPALMDSKWVYGSDASNIYATIVEGRPNGMPSFRGKLGEQEVWQLVAYVRSLAGQLPRDAEPARSDHMFDRPSPQSVETPPPVQGGEPAP
jgi:cytochrome c oxidase cbb3-type subunit 3